MYKVFYILTFKLFLQQMIWEFHIFHWDWDKGTKLSAQFCFACEPMSFKVNRKKKFSIPDLIF